MQKAQIIFTLFFISEPYVLAQLKLLLYIAVTGYFSRTETSQLLIMQDASWHGSLCADWQTTKKGRLLIPPKVLASLQTADCRYWIQVDCINKSKLKQLGISQDALLTTSAGLGCANYTSADVIGALFAKVEGRDEEVAEASRQIQGG
jgi:hypothetical protein